MFTTLLDVFRSQIQMSIFNLWIVLDFKTNQHQCYSSPNFTATSFSVIVPFKLALSIPKINWNQFRTENLPSPEYKSKMSTGDI